MTIVFAVGDTDVLDYSRVSRQEPFFPIEIVEPNEARVEIFHPAAMKKKKIEKKKLAKYLSLFIVLKASFINWELPFSHKFITKVCLLTHVPSKKVE